jgi:hypothetical protein
MATQDQAAELRQEVTPGLAAPSSSGQEESMHDFGIHIAKREQRKLAMLRDALMSEERRLKVMIDKERMRADAIHDCALSFYRQAVIDARRRVVLLIDRNLR